MSYSFLRHEYQKQRSQQNAYISEAAYKWVENNVVLIHEKIDRKKVNNLISKIQKFDDKFGPHRDQLPAIHNTLEEAENGLQMVITGELSEKKASDMLKQLSFLYNSYSSFFNKDLPILLKTNMFDAARENPEVRLDMIQQQQGKRYNPNTIKDAFSNALKPSKEEKKLIDKIYKKTPLPDLNTKEVAQQLLGLSYKDLEDLTNVGKVPMVATDDLEDGEETKQESAAKKAQGR